MSVALSVFVILLITAPGLVAEPPPALPTAVFTLDVERRTFDYEDIDSWQAKFQRWVHSCTIVPGGKIFALHCPPPSPPTEPRRRGPRRADPRIISAVSRFGRDPVSGRMSRTGRPVGDWTGGNGLVMNERGSLHRRRGLSASRMPAAARTSLGERLSARKSNRRH